MTPPRIKRLILGGFSPGEVKRAVFSALQNGYTHVDCAYVYGNENEVGEGLKEALDAGIKRDDIFITTKLWCTYHSRVEENLDLSLKSLGVDYVDLYLMHWPCPMSPKGNDPKFPKLADGSRDLDKTWSHIQTWLELEKLVKTGKVKAIGVANYSVRYLEELFPHATIVLAVNQIENHPSLPQREISLGSSGSPMLKAEAVVEVAETRGVTPAAILLSYHLASGSSVLAKSVNPDRIEANFESLVYLDESDMKVLNSYSSQLQKQGKLMRYVYPSFGVDFGFPDKS